MRFTGDAQCDRLFVANIKHWKSTYVSNSSLFLPCADNIFCQVTSASECNTECEQAGGCKSWTFNPSTNTGDWNFANTQRRKATGERNCCLMKEDLVPQESQEGSAETPTRWQGPNAQQDDENLKYAVKGYNSTKRLSPTGVEDRVLQVQHATKELHRVQKLVNRCKQKHGVHMAEMGSCILRCNLHNSQEEVQANSRKRKAKAKTADDCKAKCRDSCILPMDVSPGEVAQRQVFKMSQISTQMKELERRTKMISISGIPAIVLQGQAYNAKKQTVTEFKIDCMRDQAWKIKAGNLLACDEKKGCNVRKAKMAKALWARGVTQKNRREAAVCGGIGKDIATYEKCHLDPDYRLKTKVQRKCPKAEKELNDEAARNMKNVRQKEQKKSRKEAQIQERKTKRMEGRRFTHVAASAGFTCGVHSSGEARCWGLQDAKAATKAAKIAKFDFMKRIEVLSLCCLHHDTLLA